MKKEKQHRDLDNTATDDQFIIHRWEPSLVPYGHKYEVTDAKGRLGYLIVDKEPDSHSLRVQTVQLFGNDSPGNTYLDEAILLPTELQKAIARRRLTEELQEIRETIIQNSCSSENPELFIYDSCCVLERRLAPDEVTGLLEALSSNGDVVGLYDEDRDTYIKRLSEYTDALGTLTPIDSH
jgi:hypothetical protein